jgi:DNA primase
MSGFRWNPALTSRLWDGPTGALVMPLWENGRVVCVSYRLFDQDKPKSITLGYRPYITISNIESDTVIVVEDYISALKVSRIAPCIPLLGSNMPDDAILRLSKGYRSVYFWLDEDKVVSAMKMATKAGLLGMQTGAIYTEEDPKAYSTEELQHIIGNRINKGEQR